MTITGFNNFVWLNESAVRFEDNKMIITAPPKSDFFYHNGAVADKESFKHQIRQIVFPKDIQ